MAHHKATKKSIRKSAKRRLANRYNGKTTRNAVKKLRALENKEEAATSLTDVISKIDKLAKRNIIHKNKEANLKSKLTKKVNAL